MWGPKTDHDGSMNMEGLCFTSQHKSNNISKNSTSNRNTNIHDNNHHNNNSNSRHTSRNTYSNSNDINFYRSNGINNDPKT